MSSGPPCPDVLYMHVFMLTQAVSCAAGVSAPLTLQALSSLLRKLLQARACSRQIDKPKAKQTLSCSIAYAPRPAASPAGPAHVSHFSKRKSHSNFVNGQDARLSNNGSAPLKLVQTNTPHWPPVRRDATGRHHSVAWLAQILHANIECAHRCPWLGLHCLARVVLYTYHILPATQQVPVNSQNPRDACFAMQCKPCTCVHSVA